MKICNAETTRPFVWCSRCKNLVDLFTLKLTEYTKYQIKKIYRHSIKTFCFFFSVRNTEKKTFFE